MGIKIGETVTWTASTNMYLLYPCESCGKVHLTRQKVSASDSGSYAVFRTQGSRQKISAKAKIGANNNLKVEEQNLCRQVNEGHNYSNLPQKDVYCSNCRKKPFWNNNHKTIQMIMGIFVVASLLLLILGYARRNNTLGFWVVYIYMALFFVSLAVLITYSVLIKLKQDKYIAQLQSKGWMAPALYTQDNLGLLLDSPFAELAYPYIRKNT